MKITVNIICTACKHFGDGKTLATHKTERGLKLCDKHYEEWAEAHNPIYVDRIEGWKNLGIVPERLLQQYERGLITPQETVFQLYERGLIAPQELVSNIP